MKIRAVTVLSIIVYDEVPFCSKQAKSHGEDSCWELRMYMFESSIQDRLPFNRKQS